MTFRNEQPGFAADTDVPIEKSKAEIEHELTRYGATAFVCGWDGRRQFVLFEYMGRRIRFLVEMPHADRYLRDARGHLRTPAQAKVTEAKMTRQRWRQLLLVIKAKINAVAFGISSFDEEFLPRYVMPDGESLGDKLAPRMIEITTTGTLPALLPPRKEDR